MITMAQRIEELRTEKGLSRPALSAALGFPKTAAEKFETGRATPTAEQQKKMADFFGVSLFYLKGESNDKTRQETWMDGDFVDDDEPVRPAPKRAVRIAPQPKSGGDQGTVFGSLLRTPAFQDMVRETVLEVLRSPEGQELLKRYEAYRTACEQAAHALYEQYLGDFVPLQGPDCTGDQG